MPPSDPLAPGGQPEQPAGQPVVSPQPPFPPPAPPPAPLTGPPTQDQSYSFITNPAELPKPSLLDKLNAGGSKRRLLALAGGAILAVVVLILILRALTGGGGNAAILISVAQDQQELIHLAEQAGNEQSLSSKNKNLVATIQIAVASSQSQVIGYLAKAGKKVDEKQLLLKVSETTDEQLKASAAAGTYNDAFEDVMRDQLDAYGKNLQTAYQENKGPEGRAILSDSFDQAELLAVQLNSRD